MSETRIPLKVGDQMPPLALPSVNGPTVELREYLGRRLFIFMWASW